MDVVLDSLLKRPDLPQLVAVLNQQMQIEKELREKFIRELTPDVKAEFIGGDRITHSPARADHIRATKRLVNLLNNHVIDQRLGEVFFEKALVHLTRNDYEPDVLFFGTEKAAAIQPDQMLFPAPDFIAEILSETTEARDRGIKFEDYALHEVAEYWIIDTHERSIEQYTLKEKSYKLSEKLKAGTITSLTIPGFEIPVAAVFDDEIHREFMSGKRKT